MSALLNNRYRMFHPLGSGGFGETFLAEDIHLNRRCVIKQLKPIVDDDALSQLVLERFEREAVNLKQLGEVNNQIPKCYDYFLEGDQFYLVQEWIEGKSLNQLLQNEGKFSEDRVKRLLASLLPVIDFVHSKCIIHRDITPDNIILREQDDKPVLIDFGAIKEAANNNITTIVIGKQGFMPVEQAQGKPVYASDLYSLGMTAVCLLTGKKPKELTDPQSGEIKWYSHTTNVSRDMAGILHKALKTYAHDRYQTARDMRDALQKLQQKSEINKPCKIFIPCISIFSGNQNVLKFPSNCAYCNKRLCGYFRSYNTAALPNITLSIPYCGEHSEVIDKYVNFYAKFQNLDSERTEVFASIFSVFGMLTAIFFATRTTFQLSNNDYILIGCLGLIVAYGIFYGLEILVFICISFITKTRLNKKFAVKISKVFKDGYILQFDNQGFANEFKNLNREFLLNKTAKGIDTHPHAPTSVNSQAIIETETKVSPLSSQNKTSESYKGLLRRCLGNKEQVDRLISYERQRKPTISEDQLCQDALDRWIRDNE